MPEGAQVTASWHDRAIAPAVVLVAVTIAMTWPQALRLGSIPAHQDPLFSMWRLEWVARALSHRGVHLFDANIFYPATGTFAYSDATLLEGLLAAPLLWMGAPPAFVYNILLLLGILGSALAMFALGTYLTRDPAAGFVAALPFAFAPYRFTQYVHLEMQWAAWIPLSFLFVHRAVDRRSLGDGLAAGVCVWLQFVSGFYYSVFLAPLLGVLAALLLATDRRPGRRRAAIGIAGGGVLAIVLATPYALPYLDRARELGWRTKEILQYSATLESYSATPAQNLLWGWTAGRGGPETRLFPGSIALILAATAFTRSRRRASLVYLAIGGLALELSLGFNSGVNRLLYAHVPALGGLRVPARAAILVLAALGVLAGFGADRLRAALPDRGWRTAATALVGAAMLLEYWSPVRLHPAPAPQSPGVYVFLRRVAPAVVLELPVPRASRLPGEDPVYQYYSIYHWNTLVNGYSGYYPRSYILTLEALERFPDDRSLARLQGIGTRYIVVHRSLYEPDDYGALLVKMIERPELRQAGVFQDWQGDAAVFVLRQSVHR